MITGHARVRALSLSDEADQYLSPSDGADHVEEVGAVLCHRLHIVEGKLGLFAHAMHRD